MPRTGRPKKDLNWDVVNSLCANGASEWFIAEQLLNIEGQFADAKSIKSKIQFISRKIKERYKMTFVEYRDKKTETWRIKLRQAQWKAAIEERKPAMLIFLGKVCLGQVESDNVGDDALTKVIVSGD